MVIAHSEKAGQFAKSESNKVYQRTNFVIFSVASLMMAGIGALFSLGMRGPWYLLLVVVLIAAALVMLWKLNGRMTAFIDKAASDRLRWLRGGQAEAYVSMKLRDSDLSKSYHLFDNLMLDANSDIDHVLVGPSGIFVISTKSQKGRFRFEHDSPSGNWFPTMNGMQCDWCQDAIRQALRLREQLAVVDPAPTASGMPWIQAVLCLPFAHVEVPGKPPKVNQCWVLHEDNLIDHIAPDTYGEPAAKYSKDGGAKLRKADIERWVGALKSLQVRYAKVNCPNQN